MSILKVKYKKPLISFSLGSVIETVNVGQPIDLFLNNIYNVDFYSIDLILSAGITRTKLNNNHFILTATTSASFTIEVQVEVISTGVILKSNRVDLIAI